jgi:8-oxo-dGTP diphosphatase
MTQADRFGRLRPVCLACGWTYFPDPKVAAAVLVEADRQVLLVRRANDPLRGLWTLPAGFVDAGEDPRRAAERECLEETGMAVQVTGLLDVLYGQEHPRGAHIIIFYRAQPVGENAALRAADDVDQAAFFSLDQLPPLAFRTTERILAYYRNPRQI